MSKSKQTGVQALAASSPEQVFAYFNNKARQKLHQLKTKVMQHQNKNLPPNQRKNLSLDEIAENYLNARKKEARNDNFSKRQNPQAYSSKDISQSDSELQQFSQEQNIYLQHPLLQYTHKFDEGKKWRVTVNPDIKLTEIDMKELLGTLIMFQNGYFPFPNTNKKETKSKIYIENIKNLTERPSQKIETFKSPIGAGYWLVFHWVIERMDSEMYGMCLYVDSIKKDLNIKKIDYEIDRMLQVKRFDILPGQTKLAANKEKEQKNSHHFKFGDNISHIAASSQHPVKHILPSKLQRQLADLISSQSLNSILTAESSLKPQHQILIIKDQTNYQSVRYIYKQLANNEYFSYALSPSEYEVLQQRGNLIVIGRSGTGKTTCALLRLFFKQLSNVQKKQKNVFLTASPVLISQIAQKYNQIKEGIKQIHDYDYFNESQAGDFRDEFLIKKFLCQVDEIIETFKRSKYSNFLQYKVFPCFLTIREYIESVDAAMERPFFAVKQEKKNRQNSLNQQFIVQYPDEIQWQQRVIRKRKAQQSNSAQQSWSQIDYYHFATKICPLPEIRRISTTLSPEIIWSEIFSTIKGSSRAHSFIFKCLEFDTYCKESKNQFLSVEEKKKVYEIFRVYEKHKQETKQYDLLDVVNNIILQLTQRKNMDDLILTSLFIDQVQDLPPAFLYLSGKVVQESVFFCGDTAQTIAKGVRFSFKDICQQFESKYFQNSFRLQKPITKHLNVNFRSQNQIIQLSNSLIRCLEMMFPNSIDRMDFQVSPNVGMKPLIVKPENVKMIAALFRESALESNIHEKSNMFGADKAIIVRKKQVKSRIPHDLQKMTCLTYQECKGLQYNVVILYNFFSSCPEIQWSFLKHIELQSRENTPNTLSFDKKRLGSNIRMYFDLCSELKILYTVATRPRSVLIICDEHVPDQLMRIWKFLDVVKEISDSQEYQRYEREVNENKKQKQQQRKMDRTTQNNTNEQSHDRMVMQDRVVQQPSPNSIDAAIRFRKQWAQQAFKMFFQRKLYFQAQRCFQNIQLHKLANISHAFGLAKYACDEVQEQQERSSTYYQAAQIFNQQGRAFEAGKCYYLAKDYKMALEQFFALNIRKYMAQCYWKMGAYLEAQEIFFEQKKLSKGFEVLIESKYWFLFLARLFQNSRQAVSVSSELISRGLFKGCLSIISCTVQYMLSTQSLQQCTNFYLILKQSQQYTENYSSPDAVMSHLLAYHVDQLQGEKLSNLSASRQKQLKDRESGLTLIEMLDRKMQQESGDVLAILLNVMFFVEPKLSRYNLLKQHRKYNNDKTFQMPKKLPLQNLSEQQVWSMMGNLKMPPFTALQTILNILESFGQLEFVISLARLLQWSRVQEMIILENFIKINGKRQDALVEPLDRVDLHNRLINYVGDAEIAKRLSIVVMLFGYGKGVSHFFENQDHAIQWYFGNQCDQQFVNEEIEFRLLKVKESHKLYLFNPHSQQTLWTHRNSFTTHLYQVIFSLVDNLSPNPYFICYQKEKQYIDYYENLTKEQAQEMAKKIKESIERSQKQLARKIQQKENLVQRKEEQKIRIFAQTANDQIHAEQMKKDIAIKLSSKYVWLPQECQKQTEKAYKLKMDQKQIKKQLKLRQNDIETKQKQLVKKQKQLIETPEEIIKLQSYRSQQQEILELMVEQLQNIQISCKSAQFIMSMLLDDLQLYNKDIQELQRQKIATIKNDKMLNQKTEKEHENEYENQNDKLNSLKTDLKDAKNNLQKKTLQRKTKQKQIASVKQYIGSYTEQIWQKKNFICQLKLGYINSYTGKLIYYYEQKRTRKLLQDFVYPQIKKIKYQTDIQKRKIQKQYDEIFMNVRDFIYNAKNVPRRCLAYREDITREIEDVKKKILEMIEQKEKLKLVIEAKIKRQFTFKCFNKKVRDYRSKYLREKVLYAVNISQRVDEDFLLVLKFIQKLEMLHSATQVDIDQKNKNSTLLDEIILMDNASLQKLWFMLYFIFHEEDIQLLKNIVVPEMHNLFYDQLEDFVERVKGRDEHDQMIKNVLEILGVKVVESVDEDDLKYLQGFAIVDKTYNIATQLGKLFFHSISHSHMLCRTADVIKVFQNTLCTRVKESKILSSIINTSYITSTSQLNQFKFRNQQQLAKEQSKVIRRIRQWSSNMQTTEQSYILKGDILELISHMFDMKKLLFSQLIKIEDSQYENSEVRAEKMSALSAKLVYITSFKNMLDETLAFYNSSMKKIENKYEFVDEDTKQKAQNVKYCTIEKVAKVVNFILDIKEKQKKEQFSQMSTREQIDPEIYLEGTQQLTKGKKHRENEQNVRRKKINQKKETSKQYKKGVFENQEEIYSRHVVRANYGNQTYYDMTTGRWVSAQMERNEMEQNEMRLNEIENDW